MAKKTDQICEILFNEETARGYFSMGLCAAPTLTNARAGQFVMVKPQGILTPILRRPFGVAEVIMDAGQPVGINIIYRVVGQGTQVMSKLRKGEPMEVLGPLGNYFIVPQAAKHIVLIGGGTGVPPMLALAGQTLAKTPGCKVTVCIGGRTKDDILCEARFRDKGADVVVTTDDGSYGHAGMVTMPLLNMLNDGTTVDAVFACGPTPMLSAVSNICETSKIYCQISMEALMGCGLGACLGCAIAAKAGTPEAAEGYLHVCKDGPVFNAGVLDI